MYSLLDLQLNAEVIKDIALSEIEVLLRSNGRSLRDFPPMPIPKTSNVVASSNILMVEERNYDTNQLAEQLESLVCSLTNEQSAIYQTIMGACDSGDGGVFFVNGFGGTGKTFVWNTLTTAIRSRGDIVLAGTTFMSYFMYRTHIFTIQ